MSLNLTIILQKPTGEQYYVYPYLTADDTVQIVEAIESRAMQRSHGNVRLKFSNMTGYFSSLFATTLATTRWDVIIYSEAVVVWRGEIQNKTITFTPDDAWVTFDCWSKTKLFWDRAGAIRWRTSPLLISTYVTLSTFFLSRRSYLSDNGKIFNSENLTVYGSRRLRGYAHAPAPIGNEGRLLELDPSTTWKQILEAMQFYYNAEFYVEPASNNLVMRLRKQVESAQPKSIDSLVKKGSTSVSWLDDDKVDYLYAYGFVAPPLPIIISYEVRTFENIQLRDFGSLVPGTHNYILEGLINNQPEVQSIQVPVVLPQLNDARQGYWVTVSIPALPSVFQTRKIYRKPATTLTDFKKVRTFNDNLATTFVDVLGVVPLALQDSLVPTRGTFNFYRRYDEESERWVEDVLDTTEPPQGKILDIRPRLRFHQAGDPTLILSEDQYSVWSFFARDTTFQVFTEQWKDFFRTKRKARVTVRDMDYTLNQPITCSLLPNDLTETTSYSVRKITGRIKKEETELELVSV